MKITKKSQKITTWGRHKTPENSGWKTGRGRKDQSEERCLDFQKLMLASFGDQLSESDVYVKTGSAGGVDIHLSAKAQRLFPFAVEIKFQEALNLWAALAQAQANATPKSLPALVFFRRSN